MIGVCDRMGCSEPAIWRPVLHLRPAEYSGDPALAYVGLTLCDEHRAEATVEEFLTDQTWNSLLEGFHQAGAMVPTRRLTTLEFEAIQ